MADETGISWTDSTFNPWIGCSRVSEGCRNCYAEREVLRYGRAGWGPKAERVKTSPENWKKPLRWNKSAQLEGKRRTVFCASWADVFEDRPELAEWRDELFELIEATPWLDWLLLTKRPQNIERMIPVRWSRDGWPKNVWMGATVENQERAEERIPILLATGAHVKFLSCEPLLGPIDLRHLVPVENGSPVLQWVITGGESGPRFREMDIDDARSLRDQCEELGIVFFFKQWSGFDPKPLGHLLDGVEHHSWPTPAITVPSETVKGGNDGQRAA